MRFDSRICVVLVCADSLRSKTVVSGAPLFIISVNYSGGNSSCSVLYLLGGVGGPLSPELFKLLTQPVHEKNRSAIPE